jgi:hypothetical protein
MTTLTVRFKQVFTSPASLFAGLNEDGDKDPPKTGWWLPLATITILSVGISVLLFSKVDFVAAMEEVLSANPKIPSGQVDQIAEVAAKWTRAMTFAGGIIGPALAYFGFAVYWWLAVNLFKKPISYAKALSLYAWTDLIHLPGILIAAVAVVRAESFTSFKELMALSPGTPLFFMGDISGLSMELATLLSKFDIFTIAHIAFVALGISAITGLKKWQALSLGFAPWLLASVAPAAIKLLLAQHS